MLRWLMLVSGAIEVLFGLSALVAPLFVVEAVGGSDAGTPTLALIRLLGAATLGLGVAALLARDQLNTSGGMAAAYGLGLYNVVGAAVLVLAAIAAGGAGLWGGALLHAAIGALFCYAFATRR
jgi:hypothetical protein